MLPPNEDPDTLNHARQAQRDPQSPSWGPLAKKIQDHLGQFARTQMPPRTDFDDFVAEVMLRILRDLAKTQIRSRGEFWSWLNTVAEHALVDLWRHSRAKKRGAEREMPVGKDDQQFEPAGLDPAASELHRANEIEATEQDCIASLPNELGRRVYSLRRRHDLTFDEIAARTGQSSAAAARYVFFRMKHHVRSCLRTKLEVGYADFFQRLDAAPEA